MITARDRLPPIPEKATHIALASLLRRPGIVSSRRWEWTHIPLGGKRDKVSAAQLKSMGTKPGWPDFVFLHWTGAIYFLELKSSTGYLEPDQQTFHSKMRVWNIPCRVARSFEEAIDILQRWGVFDKTVHSGALTDTTQPAADQEKGADLEPQTHDDNAAAGPLFE
jgi:hypothetical protein